MPEDTGIIESNIVKSGKRVLSIVADRNAPLGLAIRVKAAPKIEEYIASLGDGTTTLVESLGRGWRLPNGIETPLMVYNTVDIPRLSLQTGELIRLDQAGLPLIGSRDGQSMINLSFLRLVGISEGEGVTFCIRGVHSVEALSNMIDKLTHASKRFYFDFIKPVHLTVSFMEG